MSANPGFAPATQATPDEPDGAEPDVHQSHEQRPTIFPPYNPPDGAQPASGAIELDDGPVPLPEVPSNQRSRRRQEKIRRRRLRRRRRISILAFLGVVTGAAVLLVPPVSRFAGREAQERNDLDKEATGLGGAESPAPQPGPAAAPVLLAYEDGTGRASALTVLVPSTASKGGTLVLVPPGTMTEVLSLGLEPVRQSLELGGPARLKSTVENLLGAPLGGVVVVDDAGLTNLVAPAGPLPVTVPERVERVGPNGRVEVLFEAGASTLAPPGAGRFLSAKGRENDLARLARHQAFWEAWLARLGERPEAIPARSPELEAAITALATGPVDTRLLPVEAFGTSGDGGELYKVRADELSRLVASVFPASAGQGLAGRPRVQVLNGTGALEVADAVRAKLGAGFDVRLTGNAANFNYERTEIVFYDRDQEAVADRLRQALGVGALVLSRRPLDVVDVTVVVGKDFRP
ncbi:MAG: LCP family protein [Actinomycetota bacterium]|nr:LCP family protein [Actinomycetota bacterium]